MGRKSIPDMTYEQLQEERDKNSLTKKQLVTQSETETESKLLLDLSKKILSLTRRNERLVKEQLVLMKGQLYEVSKLKPEPYQKPEPEPKEKKSTVKKRKFKKPMARSRPASYEMSIDELQAEIESNYARCDQLEKQRNSSDITTRIEAEPEIRTLANRTSNLCDQKIALLNHQISLLRQRKL